MHHRLKFFIVIFMIGILISFMSVFVVLSLLSPVRMANELNKSIEQDQNVNAGILVSNDADVNFLKARLILAATDSVCLSINLRDSVILLELKGVELYRTKINTVEMSPVFNRVRPEIIQNWIQNPFRVDHILSTIPDRIIIQKDAPEDTVALASQLTLPDTVQHESVCYQLYLDRGIRLQIFESDAEKDDAYRKFMKSLINEKYNVIFKSLIRLNIPEYYPWIKIEVSGRNAKTILRSMPMQTKVAIRF